MKLTVIHNNVDLTLKMHDLSAPVKAVNFATADLYLGYYKPIKNFYAELFAVTADRTLTVEYWDGEEWVEIEDLEDMTLGLTQSGLASFGEIEQEKTTVAGVEKYWLKLSVSSDPTVNINGINLVLSNDNDLSFVPGLSAYLPEGFTSWISFHQEATKQVIQYIRNSGKVIRKNADEILPNSYITLKQVDQFDLLNIEEFKNAAKYYALHLIFDEISKAEDDAYAAKAKRYYEKFEWNIDNRLMSIDENDDGVTDTSENQAIQSIRLRRE